MPVTESRNQNVSLTISVLDKRDNVKGLGWSKRSKVGQAEQKLDDDLVRTRRNNISLKSPFGFSFQ